MNKLSKIVFPVFLILLYFQGKSQSMIDSIGKPVTENFNSLTVSNTVGQWSQNSTLKNWYAYEMDPYSKPIDFSADSGTGTGGRLYSYGRALRSDRALGSLCSSGNDSIVFGWRLKNNTGRKVDSVKISFTGEQWRRTSGTAANKLLFFYSVGKTFNIIDSITIRNLSTKGFTNIPDLDFSSPQVGSTTSSLNGNDPANSKFLIQTLAITIAPGEELFLLWLDDDEVGNDHGLAIDDIKVAFLSKPVQAPIVSFLTHDLKLTEGDTALIELKIENANDSVTSFIIDKKSGTASKNLDYSSNFPLSITFPAKSDSNQTFSIPLVNDLDDEPDKTLELVIRNINNNGKLSADSIVNITIQDNDNPLYPIKTVSQINSFGEPDSNNVKVQVRGIVYGINYRPSGLQFTIRDGSGGIGVFHALGNFGYSVMEGDEILVSGSVGHFRGFTQLSAIDTLLKINSGTVLKSPVMVTQLDEFSESNLVKISGLRWAQSKPTSWLANSTYNFTNGKESFHIRIDGDINLAGTNTPIYDTLDITGIGSQVSTNSTGPFLDGYLLNPRYSMDIEKSASITGAVNDSKNLAFVFPNPSNGNFEIISLQPITAITIFSVAGEMVFNTKIPNLLQKSFKLDLPSGIYLLRVVSGNDVAFKRIMIK